MENDKEIAKILKITTFILAVIRAKPNESVTKDVINILYQFYQKNLKYFNETDFLKLFETVNFLGGYETFLQSVAADSTQIIPTDNLVAITKFQPLLLESYKTAIVLYDECAYSQLSDLLDTIHALPESLCYKNVWNAKAYWRAYIRPYCKKWDRQFLKSYKFLFN